MVQQVHQVVADQVEQLERIQVDLLAVAVPVQVALTPVHTQAVLVLLVACVFCGALEDLSRQQT